MRIQIALALLALTDGVGTVTAFHAAVPTIASRTRVVQETSFVGLRMSNEDCGCGDTAVVGGKPTDRALSIDPREAVRKGTIYSVSGEPKTMDELLGTPSNSGVAVVVFLRSLG
mmetsp:Transcript_46700/g.69451  ORF Transcript_46700/g.69451 Transcript_46700/m.69451 type:complete len:114 (-) Transcript_46700:761-1102(-)